MATPKLDINPANMAELAKINAQFTVETEAQVLALKARIAELETAASKKNKLGCKISEKGGLSVYGLGRFPVTLYDEQWIRLIAYIPELQVELDKARAAGKLSKKGDPKPAEAAGTRVDMSTGKAA